MSFAPRYHPSLFCLSLLTTAVAFVLIGSGGTVTSTGVGMVDETWTFSPFKLLTVAGLEESLRHLGMFIEHSHRQIGYLVGMLAMALAALCFWLEADRGNRRWLGMAVLLAVIIQGALGAARILFNPDRGFFSPYLGRDYAMIHGFFGQLTFTFLAMCTLGFSRSWVQGPRHVSTDAAGVYGLSMLLTVLFLVQLTIAVLVRHYGGDLLLIAHASMAGLIFVLTLALVAKARRVPSEFVRRPVWALAALVAMMIVLGTSAWWFGAGYGALDGTSPGAHRIALATLHQWLGALTLANSVIITMRTRRHLVPPEYVPALSEGVA
jgi:heme A synthase